MTKRANDQCAGSGDEDRRNEFTVLPFDVLRLIGEALRVDSLEDQSIMFTVTRRKGSKTVNKDIYFTLFFLIRRRSMVL